MGQRGPRPKPTEQKILEGTFRKDRAMPGEPDPVVAIPMPPDVVVGNGDAWDEWNRITVELEKLGLISQMDRMALALYCLAVGRWQTAERACSILGDAYLPEGCKKVVANPWRAIADKAHDRAKQALALFGMSPSDRTRISVDASNAANPHEKAKEFLFGNRGKAG